ncbi:MAG TPA: nitroreductase family deazaflavin-dependent oxidoreductase [Ktedonobacterales bacterium]|nr:nitroreductase family deazaflavin-dependent oxidoreductase [Ktedonobacterales bacterium]
MAKTYRVTFVVRASNWIAGRLLRLGVNMGPMVLLTVRGRKSGQPRTTPVAMTEYEGKRYVVGTFGNVNWVRNLRAAGEATLTRGRRAEQVSAVELPTAEAARFLKQILPTAPGFIRGYFDVTPDSPLEAFEREAPRHPVFLMQPIAQQARDAARETVKSGSL